MPDISDNINWSEYDAQNNQASPNGWPEGMMPSGINDAARADKGALKRFWDRINPTVTTADPPSGSGGGATYVYTTSNPNFPANYTNGEIITFVAHKDSVGGDTFGINSLAPMPLYRDETTPIAAGDIKAKQIVRLVYLSSLHAGAGGFSFGSYQPLASAWAIVTGPTPTQDYTISRASDSGLALKIENGNLQVDVAQHLTVGAGAAITGALSVSGLLTASAGLAVTGTLGVSGNATIPGITYPGTAGHVIAFGWDGANINGWVDGGNQGALARWNTAAQFASGMTIGGLAIVNNGGWLQSPSIRASSSFYTDGSLTVQTNAAIAGYITVGGCTLQNSGGWLYTPQPFQTNSSLQVNANATVNGDIHAGTCTIGGVALSGNNANVPGTMTAGTANASSGTIGGVQLYSGNCVAGAAVVCNTLGVNAGSGYGLQNGSSIYTTYDVQAGGNMLAQNFYQSSDARLKEGIATWKPGLDAVLALRPVSYRLKRGGESRVGLIADEAEKVIPEMVSELPAGPEGGEIKAIDLAVLPVALVNAVRELAARVKQLEGK